MAIQSDSRMAHGKWTRRLVVIVVTLLGSVVTFWALVHFTRPGWRSHEYAAIVVWTLPLAFFVLLFGKLARKWFGQRASVVRFAGSLGIAGICAVFWTFLAVFLTGGYALAFDANPLVCWTVGSVAGMLVDLEWHAHDIRGINPPLAI